LLVVGLNYAPEPTGIARYTTGMAEGLAERGHTVRVIAGYPHYPAWSITPGYRGMRLKESIAGVEVTRVRHSLFRAATPGGRVALEATFAAHSVVQKWGQPDVVLTVTPSLLGAAAVVTRVRNAGKNRPAVGVIVQDIYTQAVLEGIAPEGLPTGAVERVESSTLRHADGVSVIHDRFRSTLVESLGVPDNRVQVIRNWSEPLPPARDAAAARRRFGWAHDEVVVLHAGNMGVKQGLQTVIEAARLADEGSVPMRFVLLGDGNQRETLADTAEPVRRLQMLGTLPDDQFAEAISAADILLVNERPGMADMSVPSKLTTYFMVGKPVLAATEQHGATAAELSAAGAGVRVDPGQPKAILDAARGLASNPGRARSLSAAGLAYARTVLSREAALQRYDEWVQRLAAR
jgi:glycosyltransferase involved in cell wall biosynthesis